MNVRISKVARRPHLSTLVASSISREIAQGRLGPGDQLPTEQALATTFGVSRSVVREAIARLRSEGLVWSQQGRGFFVSNGEHSEVLRLDDNLPHGARDFRSLFELREILEPRTAALAASRRDATGLAQMSRAIDNMRSAPYGSVPWLAADLAFHAGVATAARNPYLARMAQLIADGVRESILAAGNHVASDELANATLAEHGEILTAISNGDSEAAEAAMRLHLERAAERIGPADERRP